MKSIWDKIPEGFRKRPFDAYTAIALIAIGLYGFFSPVFPEENNLAIGALLFHIIEIYFVVASVTLLIALLSDKKTHTALHYLGQMYSWAFIAAAGISVMTFIFWTEVIELTNNNTISPNEWLIFFLFGCVGWAAFVRSLDLWMRLRRLKKEGSWTV